MFSEEASLERGAESRGMEPNRLRLVRKWQVDHLVGELLTYIEATYSDKVQQEAHKSIVKTTIYDWFRGYCWLEGLEEIELGQKIGELIDQLRAKK